MALKIPPLLLVLLFALAGWLLTWFGLGWHWDMPLRLGWLIGWGLGGLLFAFAGVLSFRRGNTTVDPTRPDKASKLINGGIYQRTRNPMYVGFASALVGWGGYLTDPLALLLVPVFIWYLTEFQIKPEEQALTELFGEEYQDYCHQVRRWL
ncbi:isoprenylcysteine carboxylmethyltransferase family protein [Shewanella corallii]|uniref:Isoprenylcysteine carboxylmethyltransferase family protein n=2 Tax=Shewanella TaxID=22 RepID=A0ABT0NDS2_9GAMM|nr:MULTISPECIES: isoprenylcysteine carboxylmethyltransferase family protein [Shewanella]MCL1038671.1 isoprenylcysteine carboxylmethyltransferase family protein [Shewanella submarina]MCL2916502.1 isoprenylcysteine carboxylmethyltransferase family protein [Shewanella corallii]